MTNKAAKTSVKRFMDTYDCKGKSGEEIGKAYKKARRVWNKHRGTMYLMQKLLGVFIIVMSILIYPLADGDGGYMLMTIPFGLFAIFSKRYIFFDNFLKLDRIMSPEKYKY